MAVKSALPAGDSQARFGGFTQTDRVARGGNDLAAIAANVKGAELAIRNVNAWVPS